MSQYRHDSKKFADTGLQLRLPVDLVPATQYSRLTNALPVIEGELRTRDGMTFIANVTQVAFVYQLERPNTTDTCASIFDTVYFNGYIVGDTITITIIATDPSETSTVVPGTYTVTITEVNDNTGYGTGGYGVGDYGGAFSLTFAPCIPVTWDGTNQTILVFAQAVSNAPFASGVGYGLGGYGLGTYGGVSLTSTLVNTPITNLFRLNEAVTALNGDRIAAMNGRVFHAPLPAGNAFEELVGPIAPGGHVPQLPMGFSGRPLVIAEFRFTKDTASWAILADQAQMYKYRPGLDDTQIEFVPLGNAPPTVAATATANGAGNLNSTAGTGYDWRYTYVDGYALTESNPSPITMTGGGTSTTQPTTYKNPAITGDHSFVTPISAIDNSLISYSSGSVEASAEGRGNSDTQQASCQWFGWLQPGGTVDSITLNVIAEMAATATNDGGGLATSSAVLSYSYDGGVTFHTLKSINANLSNQFVSTGRQSYSATVPSSVSLTNLVMRATAFAHATGATRGDDLFGGDASALINVYNISTTIVTEGTVVQTAVVNQSANVCVTPSPLPQHKFINLYRRGGSLTDAWRLVGQFQQSTLVQGGCGAGTVEINDNVSDTALSVKDILQLDNDQPVTSVTITKQPLPFIWGPVGLDARLLACGDPARPESVYFSKPGNADAWPPQNFVEVSAPGTPIIAGCVFNTRTFAFSRESIYELVEGLGTGATYTPFRTPSAHGLYSPYALAVGPFMYFVAKDGIYQSAGGQEQSIVENDIKPIFPTYDTPGETIEGYEAVDMSQSDAMRLRYHNDELYFEYVGLDTGTRQQLVYDILKKRWRAAHTSAGISELYTEPATISSLLYGTVAGTIYQAGGPFDPIDFDVVENMGIGSATVATTFPTETLYVRGVRYTGVGPVAMSYEIPVLVGATTAIQVAFPVGPPGTLKWRVFYGTTTGAQDQYMEYFDSLLPANRTVQITTTGTAGTLPTINVDTTLDVVIRTGAHDQGAPLNQKQYGNVLIDLDPGGATSQAPVTITPYVNGEAQAQAALTVTGRGRQQVPLDLSDYFAFNTEYEVKWSRTLLGDGVTVTDPVLFQYDTLHFLEPVQVTHWQAQPTSFEFPGFVHVRDVYVAIRSTADVTLTVTIDGTTVQTYNVPSTNNQRQKVYVQLGSNKGLMYQFALDSTTNAGFRVYEADIEFRSKPWLGVLGYSVQRVMGGEVNA